MVFITPRIVSMTPKPTAEATAKEPAPSETPAKNHKEEAILADDPAKTTQGAAAPPQ